jgi:hypothetical protein
VPSSTEGKPAAVPIPMGIPGGDAPVPVGAPLPELLEGLTSLNGTSDALPPTLLVSELDATLNNSLTPEATPPLGLPPKPPLEPLGLGLAGAEGAMDGTGREVGTAVVLGGIVGSAVVLGGIVGNAVVLGGIVGSAVVLGGIVGNTVGVAVGNEVVVGTAVPEGGRVSVGSTVNVGQIVGSGEIGKDGVMHGPAGALSGRVLFASAAGGSEPVKAPISNVAGRHKTAAASIQRQRIRVGLAVRSAIASARIRANFLPVCTPCSLHRGGLESPSAG